MIEAIDAGPSPFARYLRDKMARFNERRMSSAIANLKKKTKFEMKRQHDANGQALLNQPGAGLYDDVVSIMNDYVYPYSVSKSGDGRSSSKIKPKDDAMIVTVCALFHSFDVIQTLFCFFTERLSSIWKRQSVVSIFQILGHRPATERGDAENGTERDGSE